jgi:hypothetical protein
MTLRNASDRRLPVYYQVDHTLHPLPVGTGRLHATFRRENPTVLKRDFVIEDGLRGPGRFLGCVVGLRTIDPGVWYGEGEVKVFRDGDEDLPTICGTGLEDYVGTAWGMAAHVSHYAGVPLDVRRPGAALPDFVGFYRWHVLDPIAFETSLRVTIQQIGYEVFPRDDEERMNRMIADGLVAGNGLTITGGDGRRTAGHGIVERVDDYCAVSFVMCAEAQVVPRLRVADALADIGRRDHEQPDPMEALFARRD